MTSRLEGLLHDALVDAGEHVRPSDDLFVRVQTSIAGDRRYRRRRRIITVAASVVLAALVALTLLIGQQGESAMDWWMLELATFLVLTGLALFLGPFIKRFGRSYAADVFRSNPSTGKSFIVLTDFAYYLIFASYILFTTTLDRPSNWTESVGAEQLQHSIVRVGGILLIIGLLHSLNLLVLPIIGRLLTLNRRLDQQMREHAERLEHDS